MGQVQTFSGRTVDAPPSENSDEELSILWLLRYFHPTGLRCPHCHADQTKARIFRQTKKSHLIVYRCRHCQGIYNIYSGTALEGRYLRPTQAVMLLHGLLGGTAMTKLARNVGVSRQTVYEVRNALQTEPRSLIFGKSLAETHLRDQNC